MGGLREVAEHGMQCLQWGEMLSQAGGASDAKGERLEYNTCISLVFGWHLPPAYTCQSATAKPHTLRYDVVGNLSKSKLVKAEMEGFFFHQGIVMHSSSLCSSRLWPNSKTA